jgi:hypothetical protein
MRRFVALLSVVAIVALSSSAAFADFHYGNWYFVFSNWNNGGGVGSGPAWVLPTGPTATTDGAIWEKTESNYALVAQDFNAEIDFRDGVGGTQYVITNTYLLSTGVAYYDTQGGAYPGYWLGADGADGWGNHWPDPSPYRIGSGEFYVPTADFADPSNFQLRLKIWLGNQNSYSAAAGAGDKVADSGWFAAGPMASGLMPPDWSTFVHMPSLVLQPTPAPEPSTIVLVTTGLVGLLAYAWRRRR